MEKIHRMSVPSLSPPSVYSKRIVTSFGRLPLLNDPSGQVISFGLFHWKSGGKEKRGGSREFGLREGKWCLEG